MKEAKTAISTTITKKEKSVFGTGRDFDPVLVGSVSAKLAETGIRSGNRQKHTTSSPSEQEGCTELYLLLLHQARSLNPVLYTHEQF